MDQTATAMDPYILYTILGFIILVGVAMLGTLFRLLYVVGKIEGRLTGLESAVADLRQDHAGLRQEIRQDNADLRQDHAALRQEMRQIWEQLGHLREQVAENRGLLRALHERIDLVMRHRHDDRSGAVVLTPTEPVPDPAAD